MPFTGGDLVVKQDQRTKTFAWEAAQDGLIEWACLYSDCEHEVLPVTSGTRVTIAYDVWWCGDITAKDASKLGIDRSPIYKYLQALLDDKTHFLPKGGKIGFGMRHAYPVENTDEIPAKLKGVDRTVQLALLSLGLKWEIKAAYDYIYDYFGESSQESNDDMSVDGSDADAADNGDEPEHNEKDDSDIIEKVRDEDIISLRTTGYRLNVFCGNHPKWVQGADTESTDLYDVLTEEENAARRATDIIWITQVGAYGCESSYMAYGNEVRPSAIRSSCRRSADSAAHDGYIVLWCLYYSHYPARSQPFVTVTNRCMCGSISGHSDAPRRCWNNLDRFQACMCR